jgi:hypothetical protein
VQGAIRSCLTAGVALVGVGIITVAPVAPKLPEIQVSSMPTPAGPGAAASADPASAWLRVFQHGGIESLSQFGSSVAADSAPGIRQLIATQFDYSQALVTGGFAARQDVAQWSTTGLPAEFQAVVEALAQGDVVSANTALNGVLLGTTLVPTQVFLDVLQIPVQITDKLTNVVRAVVSLNTLMTLLVGAVGPLEAVLTAAVDTSKVVSAGLSTGDTDAAIAALIAAPGAIAGAFLNGYTNDQGFRFPGIFTVDTENPGTGGLLQTLLVTLPRTILTALGFTPAPTGAGVDADAGHERAAVAPEGTTSTPGVAVVHSAHAASTAKPKSTPASTAAASAEDPADEVPTTTAGEVAKPAEAKGSNKTGDQPKHVTTASKPSSGSSTGVAKSSGSRSSKTSTRD